MKWRNDQNKLCRSWEVIQLYSWKVFHLNSFRASKITFKNWFAEGQKKYTRQNASLPSAKTKALGKIHICRVPEKRHSAKTHFAGCWKMTLSKIHLCRVLEKRHSAKTHFVECFFLPSVFYLALGKDRFCLVPDKIHSAKLPALGKVPVSSSVYVLSSL